MSACKSCSQEDEANENQSQTFSFLNSCHYRFTATAPVPLAVRHNEEGNVCLSRPWPGMTLLQSLLYSSFSSEKYRAWPCTSCLLGNSAEPSRLFQLWRLLDASLIGFLLLEPHYHIEKRAVFHKWHGFIHQFRDKEVQFIEGTFNAC